jgi:hypothetical protein
LLSVREQRQAQNGEDKPAAARPARLGRAARQYPTAHMRCTLPFPAAVGADGPPQTADGQRLVPAECCRLLGPRGTGRIAFCTASGLAVLQVNYAVTDAAIGDPDRQWLADRRAR